MDNTQILIWVVSGGFAGTWALLFYLINRVGNLSEEIRDIGRLCRLGIVNK